MEHSDTNQTVFITGAAGLARILSQDEPQPVWAPQEMAAMWQHQMRAPIDADLASVRTARASALRNASDAAPFQGRSFSHLLHHDAPCLKLLQLTKDFAKQTLKEAEDPQLKEVTAVLYYASYAAGIVRCGTRLGGMSEHELAGGFDWALKRAWLDDTTRKLIKQARKSMK